MPLHLADPRLSTLFGPLGPLTDEAVSRLGPTPSLRVDLGDVPGFYRLDGEHLTLSEGLLDGSAEPSLLPLDRWRRALSCALEALALASLGQALGRAPGADWIWQGWAIDAADRAAPGLSLAAPDLALAVLSGDPGAHPRAGVAIQWAWRRLGEDPTARTIEMIQGEPPRPGTWLRLAARVDAEDGPVALLPSSAGRPPPLQGQGALSAWSWRRVSLSHPRGGQLTVEGPGAVQEPWVNGGETARTLFAATGPASLNLEPGAPTGSWELASLHGFGRVMGARGTTVEIAPDGGLEFVLADSFVGPIEALSVAAEMGTSGTVSGRWRICGPGELRMSGLRPMGLTVHGPGGRAIPAAGEREGWIAAIQTGPWRWEFGDKRLILRGTMFGNAVELRLRASD